MTRRESLPVRAISLDEVVAGADRLARMLRESGYQPDTVIAVARGGFMPARFVCDFLGVSRLMSVKVQHYAAGAHAGAEALVTVPLGGPIEGERVLVVDDVNDSGETLRALHDYLADLDPATVRTAVLHEKAVTACRADFVAESIREWHWILYPWAVVEDVGQFLRDMDPAPTTRAEALARLRDEHELVLGDVELERVIHFHGLALAGS
ncbi:phosphoribosyltransferase [Guyparkeria hydrothermalis]|uniref:phosphoribosyltransferase n=1 Tax=Guyparkeria hydrothermalis TaxID=923 RepID=UPI0020206E32|nr:phosphoribosyltransferase [Guyparkeria hydrothermalis]MCL7751382.1 phosphoribosyltransferase [Guyparkeria hydrothermalis]